MNLSGTQNKRPHQSNFCLESAKRSPVAAIPGGRIQDGRTHFGGLVLPLAATGLLLDSIGRLRENFSPLEISYCPNSVFPPRSRGVTEKPNCLAKPSPSGSLQVQVFLRDSVTPS